MAQFEKSTFGRKLATMLHVDFRRMFTMPLIYIMVGACLVMPVLILVMTTMTDGSVTVNPQTGVETVIEGFDNVWQIIGTVSGGASSADAAATGMSMIAMCNINLLYFFIAVLVCLFVADDFLSGYAKNLFTVRAKKADYVISKTLVCAVGGGLMILAFFVGSLLGGAIAGLPFDMVGFDVGNLVMCVLPKVLIVAVFVPVYLLWSVIAKQKVWLSLMGSPCMSMLFFMMIPMLTPLDSTLVNVIISLLGGMLFSVGLGAVSSRVLAKRDLL